MSEIENLYRIARNPAYSDTHRDLAARAITRAGRPRYAMDCNGCGGACGTSCTCGDCADCMPPASEQTIARPDFGDCTCGKHVYRAMNGNWYHSDSQPTGTMQLACTQDPANQR